MVLYHKREGFMKSFGLSKREKWFVAVVVVVVVAFFVVSFLNGGWYE